jgi:hypothetical protein
VTVGFVLAAAVRGGAGHDGEQGWRERDRDLAQSEREQCLDHAGSPQWQRLFG